MTFTDDDLERLEANLETLISPQFNPVYLLALVRRLKAAEKCINDSRGHVMDSNDIEAWRAEKGE